MSKSSISGIRSVYEKQFISNPDPIGNYLIHQIGEQVCEPGYRCSRHVQWCYEISMVVDGVGINSIDNVETEVRAGDLFITPVGVTHQISATDQFRYLFIGFSIPDATVSEDIRLIDLFYKSPPTEIMKAERETMDLFTRCLNEFYNQSFCHNTMIESRMNELVISVMRLYLSQSKKNYRNELQSSSTGISPYAVRLYIDTCIRTVQGVNDIAQKFNYSPSYLSHCFNRQMGMTLQQYICRRKIEESVRMIEDEGLSAAEASQQVGFATPQAYTRAFKRVMGVPPKEYLRRRRSEQV